MAKTQCPLCDELLDEEDPAAAGEHMGSHLGVVNMGPLLMMVGFAGGVLGMTACSCSRCTDEDEPQDGQERVRRDFQRGMGG